MAGQGLGRERGQRRGQRQGARLGDQLPVENVGEGTLHAVVDGAPAGVGEGGGVEIFKDGHQMNRSRQDVENTATLCLCWWELNGFLVYVWRPYPSKSMAKSM